MEHRQLMDHYVAHSFEYGSMSLDILSLKSGTTMTFVDAGFRSQGQQLRLWGLEQRVQRFELIISHLHKDHYQGALGLEPDVIFGPSLAEHSLPEELVAYESRYKNWATSPYTLEHHKLTHDIVGGHSGCSQLIILDQQLVHVGDLIIMTPEGHFSLPLVMGRVADYQLALQRIIDLRLDGFLGHGAYVPYKKLVYGAERTLDYLHELQSEQCSPEVTDLKTVQNYHYSNLKYHAFNWRYHRGKIHV
jgi:glyoxylase-like metal-dependent hydrolase (beta-lactamase superfamily II)